MAIRDDFTAGEVLAAADLNDTFASKIVYPSGGADGNALIKSGTSAAWGTAGGLALVTSEDFTAVSSISINGAFTSSFDNYRVIGSLTTNSSGANLLARLRASGTDNTSSVYSSMTYIGFKFIILTT